MLSLRNTISLLFLLSLTGCAASVKYAPRVPGFRPGYSEQRLGENTYQVKIGEAWPKDWQDLEKFAMYRAAEITQTRGKRYFTVLNASSRISNYTVPLPGTSTTTGTVNTIGSTSYINATTTTSGGGNLNISGGWYTLDYKIIADSEISGFNNVVDSTEVIQNLKFFIDSRR